MPTLNQFPPQYPARPHQIEKTLGDRLYGERDIAKHELAEAVAELRKEIAALRAEIAPQFSTIITGLEAIRAFQSLKGIK